MVFVCCLYRIRLTIQFNLYLEKRKIVHFNQLKVSLECWLIRHFCCVLVAVYHLAFFLLLLFISFPFTALYIKSLHMVCFIYQIQFSYTLLNSFSNRLNGIVICSMLPCKNKHKRNKRNDHFESIALEGNQFKLKHIIIKYKANINRKFTFNKFY